MNRIRDSESARARRLSVKNLIVAVALVPLLAIGWLAGSASWAVASDRRVASDVRRRVVVVDARTGQPVGAEALIRWTRPGIGRVGPDEFIPVAERSDLILTLDAWVVREAADQLARWQAAGVLQDRWVSINLSGAHVCRPEVVPLVLEAPADAGVDPHHLVIEITERELLADVELAAEHLRVLRSPGVQVAIDDFGTGFTSLSHLRWLPIDKLKIDKSFVTNLASPNDESLVRLVIETGHVLGVSVTAEGVETEDHLDALRNLGADYIQGYLTGRPEAPVDRPVR